MPSVPREGRGPNCAGHYSSWLQYGHLQLGQVEEAEALMDLCHGRALDDPGSEEWLYFTKMRARQIVDSGDWESVERWTVPVDDLPGEQIWGEGYPSAQLTYRITNALAHLELGNQESAQALTPEPRPEDPMAALQIDQLAGLLALRPRQNGRGAGPTPARHRGRGGSPLPVRPTGPVR